jgi:hypothetical protein
LLLRGFFNLTYDNFLQQELDEANEFLHEKRLMISVKSLRIPLYITLPNEEFKEYEHFFLLLKFNLLEKLRHCKPQYFLSNSPKLQNSKVIHN